MLLFTIVMIVHAEYRREATSDEQSERGKLAASLKLTDLCLFTEARYTRHPAMSDHFAPFQDYPSALEHFPSGSLVSPPDMRPYVSHP